MDDKDTKQSWSMLMWLKITWFWILKSEIEASFVVQLKLAFHRALPVSIGSYAFLSYIFTIKYWLQFLISSVDLKT